MVGLPRRGHRCLHVAALGGGRSRCKACGCAVLLPGCRDERGAGGASGAGRDVV